jgi:hypothetical protein
MRRPRSGLTSPPMRRLAVPLAAVALCVLGAGGCGGNDPRPSTPLDDALGYFAHDAPFVAAVETDPDGPQIKQAMSLIGRFPAGGLLAAQLERLTRFRSLDYGRDIRPLLGAPLVVGLTRPAAGRDLAVPLVAAIRVDDPIDAKRLLLRQPDFLPRGSSSGARIYEDPTESRYAAVDGHVLLEATNRDILEQALGMHRTENRMREKGFEADLAGLPAGALARVSADPRSMIGVDPRLRPALDVKWLSSMRRLSAVLKASPDGLALDFHVATDSGSITDADLPLAPRAGPLPLVGGAGDVKIGVREPGRLARLALAVWRAVAPRHAARIRALEPAGVDLERQLPRHLGNAGVLALDPFSRAFAARADIRHPADVQAALATLAPVLPDMAAALGVPGVGIATPQAGESFYALARPNGKMVVFGVVGGSVVAATEPRRAAGLASGAASTAPGPLASAVVTLDARALAGKLLAWRLKGPAARAAPLAVSALRDLTGSLTIGRSGLRGHFRLKIVR